MNIKEIIDGLKFTIDMFLYYDDELHEVPRNDLDKITVDACKGALDLIEKRLSIDDIMSVFDDFMRGDVNENDKEVFKYMLLDKAESEVVMPHSLRSKIKGLRYKGIITDKDCDRLCKALDNEDMLDKIRNEIEEKYGGYDICECFEYYDHEENYISEYCSVGNMSDILAIIDKYKAESEDKE